MKKIHAIAVVLLAAVLSAPLASAVNPLDALKGAIGAVIGGSGTSKTIPEGTFKYAGPAVSFKSDNALQNLGGAAAGTALESKLAPYYTKLGLTSMTFTAGSDSTFVMTVKKMNLKGTIEYGSEAGVCVLYLQGLGKIVGGQFTARWQMVGNSLSLTFDISKLVELLSKIAAVSGKSSLTSLTKVLQSYDGVYAGFRLEKQK
ncbi:MAG: DUF4923 family protein [Muribaculaceae bacterium]|nr:DUF4923 family protein [Muribaculaceae bacterium]